ncbi:glycosyltransferase [Dongia deserti]|uniref:glycosyltransferase n=1 Tax=Dongia deserti TaxID=2268030 RepID=UPI000E6542EF|nr:glycosyltransferase [Dongia deserti]
MSSDTSVLQSRGRNKPNPNAPTVLHLVSRLDGGGGARLAIDLSSGLVESGGRALIAYDGEASSTYELTRHKITPITEALTSRNPISGYTVTRRLAYVIREQKVDLVHAQNATLAAVGEAAARKAGAKMITTFCDGPGEVATLSKKTRTALINSDHVLTLSYLTANLLADALPELRERVSVVPYGIDLTRFDPQRVTPQRMIQMAQAWRLPDDKHIVMLPARYVPQKGHALLLEALTELKDIDLRCLMVGPSQDGGAYRDQLEKLVKMMELEDRVLLADECRDMPAVLMLADLVVAPYLTPSTYNRVVIEAQALGRPLVVSDYPCARELVEGSSMAWLVPPNDAQALAWAIRDALALPSEERQARTPQVIQNLQRRSDRDWMRHRVLGMYWDISGKPGSPF